MFAVIIYSATFADLMFVVHFMNIVISTTINHLQTYVSLTIICCLRLFLIVYKHVML